MTAEQNWIPALVVTGAVGAGKSSVAAELYEMVNDAGGRCALVDMDWLREARPRPAADPFHMALGFRNLLSVWANYRAAGADRVIVVDVVETPEQRAEYLRAIPGADLQIVRLTASVATLQRRLVGRERGESLRWHQARAAELTALMEARGIGDHVIDTEGQTIDQVAAVILERIGWRV